MQGHTMCNEKQKKKKKEDFVLLTKGELSLGELKVC